MASLASSVLLTAAPTFTPFHEPPPGIISNPDHPQTLKKAAHIAISVCCILTTIFFAARCYCRFWIKSTFIFEDVTAIIAWAGTVVNCALVAVTMNRHGGEHVWDINAEQFHEAAFWFNVVSIEYGIMIGATKITILMLYRRVFVVHRWSWFDTSVIVLITILSLFYGITTFFKIFQCTPREKIWNSALPGHCYDIGKILKTSGAFNTVTDYVMLLLPVQAVQKLRMNKQKKVLVVLIFTFGLCAPVFATIGFVVRLQRSTSNDTSWNQPTILLWGLAELTSGNLCISFPEMNSLFHTRTRTRRKSNTPRRPTESELAPYNEPYALSPRHKKKFRSDPFMMSSLVGTTGTTTLNDDGRPYTELHESKYKTVAKIADPNFSNDAVAITNSEISVKSQNTL